MVGDGREPTAPAVGDRPMWEIRQLGGREPTLRWKSAESDFCVVTSRRVGANRTILAIPTEKRFKHLVGNRI